MLNRYLVWIEPSDYWRCIAVECALPLRLMLGVSPTGAVSEDVLANALVKGWCDWG